MEIEHGLAIIGKYKMKAFTGDDWEGYAGATPISDEIPPYHCEFEFTDYCLTIIVDGCGIEVYYNIDDDYDEEPLVYRWDNGSLSNCLKFLDLMRFNEEKDRLTVKWILDNMMANCN